MCGFVGIVGSVQTLGVNDIFAMTDAIKHRGPNDQGFYVFSMTDQTGRAVDPRHKSIPLSNGVGGVFGFRRLAIQDLSDAGHQPMVSDDGNSVINFNGEIYNANKLRQKLCQFNGVNFRGSSDTEVILQLYRNFGFLETVNLLDGMFALCILDLREKKLFLARDHAGIKPLYIYKKEGNLLFSSEVKAFRHSRHYRFGLNENILSEYLLFRHIAGSKTLYQDVEELPPGAIDCYQVGLGGDLHHERSYFYTLPLWSQSSVNDVSFIDILKESVNQQLISDVPVGCQLSGGIDSSLTSLLANNGSKRFETFSVVIDEASPSEEPYIDIVNTKIGCKGNKYIIDDNYFVDNLEDATYHLDHPLHHPNSIGIHFLARNACSKVTVILSGEGGDEMFGGYSRFIFSHFGGSYFNGVIRDVNRISNKLSGLKQFGMLSDRTDNYISLTGYDMDSLYSIYPDFNLEVALQSRRDIFKMSKATDFTGQIFDYEFRVYLKSLLKRQDKMTMAFSMENRVPFLGKKFIADCRTNFTYADFIQINNIFLTRKKIINNTKIKLKQASARSFGSDFTYRAKQGFSFPIARIMSHVKINDKFFSTYLPLLINLAGLDKKNSVDLWNKRTKYPEEAFTMLTLGSWLSINTHH